MASKGINKVILIGYLGQDPDIRYMPNGGAVASIALATSETWRDKQTGEMREQTEWHRVVLFGKLAEVASEYLRKGAQVYIDGQLRTRKWTDQTGQERYTTEVVVHTGGTMQMLGSRQNSAQGGRGQPQQPQQGRQFSGNSPSPGNTAMSGSFLSAEHLLACKIIDDRCAARADKISVRESHRACVCGTEQFAVRIIDADRSGTFQHDVFPVNSHIVCLGQELLHVDKHLAVLAVILQRCARTGLLVFDLLHTQEHAVVRIGRIDYLFPIRTRIDNAVEIVLRHLAVLEVIALGNEIAFLHSNRIVVIGSIERQCNRILNKHAVASHPRARRRSAVRDCQFLHNVHFADDLALRVPHAGHRTAERLHVNVFIFRKQFRGKDRLNAERVAVHRAVLRNDKHCAVRKRDGFPGMRTRFIRRLD